MEENKVEEIVDETAQKPVEEKPNQQDSGDENVVKVDTPKFKVRDSSEPTVTKVDLRKPTEDKTTEGNAEDDDTTQEQKEEVQPKNETQETPAVEEITEEEEKADVLADKVEDAVVQSEQTGKPLPENIQRLVNFMEETGGDLVDYVKLTQDYSKLDDDSLLKEYYKATKTHLNDEEINFLMEDQFSFDEDVDEERDVKRKKLALKEQVANAKSHLDGLKSKYYHEIKAGSKLTGDQQKAVDFFDRYKKTTQENKETNEVLATNYSNKTEEFFGEEFKGFEYKIGDKRFRFNVNNANEIKESNANPSHFVRKFLNEKTGKLEDAAGYHKSLFTAMNPDVIARHFYEQGKADGLKNSVAKSKNISMDPRQSHGEVQNTGGPSFKVLGNDSASFKWKIKNNK